MGKSPTGLRKHVNCLLILGMLDKLTFSVLYNRGCIKKDNSSYNEFVNTNMTADYR